MREWKYVTLEAFFDVQEYIEQPTRAWNKLQAAAVETVEVIDLPDQMIRYMSSCVVMMWHHACQELPEVGVDLQTR